MRSVVYIDVLFILNIYINYFLLRAVSGVMHITPSRLRLLCGSLLGGVYALFIFLPDAGTFVSLAAKLFFSATIVLISFRWDGIKLFFKLLAAFYLMSFIFAGIMLGVWFAFKPHGLIINNGIVYFDVSLLTLALSTVVCYLIVTLSSKLIRRNAPDNEYCELTIRVGDCEVSLKGIVDTGNSLRDAFTDKPVIVADYQSVKDFFTDRTERFFQGVLNISDVADEAWRKRLRLIPYSSVGRGEGLLPAFRPDSVTVSNVEKSVCRRDVIIAVSRGELPRGDFSALINPRIIE